MDVGMQLGQLVLTLVVIWQLWAAQRDSAAHAAMGAALEARVAHLQNGVFHLRRMLETANKNAATEPSMRVGDAGAHRPPFPFRDTERMSEEDLERALAEAAAADSDPPPVERPAARAEVPPRRRRW